MNSPFILTGASGWFGKAALLEYELLMGPKALRTDVIAFASTEKEIEFGSDYGPIRALPLENIFEYPKCSGILHLAFLTRDHIYNLGIDKYAKINRRITSVLQAYILSNPTVPIITTSSGATKASDDRELTLEDNPYAVLKKEEEKVWHDNSIDRLSLVLRVYAASGRFMKDPRIFALGDFISNAVEGKRIVLKNNRIVLRSYVNVGCLMRLCWSILRKPNHTGYIQVNACTDTVSLLDLAELISSIWGLPDPLSNIDYNLPPNIYTAEHKPFQDVLADYGVISPSLRDQIIESSRDIHLFSGFQR